jgi:hypothetical protein
VNKVERTLEERIPGPPEQVRSFYVDLGKIADIHPLVVSVRTVDRQGTADGYRQTYRIKDVVPLGFLRLPVTYTAELNVPDEGPVTARSRQFPRVRLDSSVSFAASPGGTLLTEQIVIRAPWPLLSVTVRQAVAAHTEMLAALRRRFESQSP